MMPEDELMQIARSANSRRFPHLPDVIPYAQKALKLIEAHPQLRQEFESQFIYMATHLRSEMIEICMHALRWPSVRKEFQAQHRTAVSKGDIRTADWYEGLLKAFEDDWEDAQLFYAPLFGEPK